MEATTEQPEPMQSICAWCHPGVTGENITHGICNECLAKELEKLEQ